MIGRKWEYYLQNNVDIVVLLFIHISWGDSQDPRLFSLNDQAGVGVFLNTPTLGIFENHIESDFVCFLNAGWVK